MIFISWSADCFIAEEGQEIANDDAPENNPQYTTVYVGNLAPEARIFFPLLTVYTLLVVHIGLFFFWPFKYYKLVL